MLATAMIETESDVPIIGSLLDAGADVDIQDQG